MKFNIKDLIKRANDGESVYKIVDQIFSQSEQDNSDNDEKSILVCPKCGYETPYEKDADKICPKCGTEMRVSKK